MKIKSDYRPSTVKLLWVAIASTILSLSSHAAGDESHLAAANALYQQIMSEEVFYGQMNHAMAPQIIEWKQAGFTDQQISAIQGAFGDFAKAIVNDEGFRTHVTNKYVQSFSEAELKELLAFYKSPLGQKSVLIPLEYTEEGKVVLPEGLSASEQKELVQFHEESALGKKLRQFIQESSDEEMSAELEASMIQHQQQLQQKLMSIMMGQ